MSEAVRGPFYTVPWCPGAQEVEMTKVVWEKLSARAADLRQLSSPRVVRQAITMRSMEGKLFGSPIDQLVGYLGMLASPGPGLKRTRPPEAERIAV